MSNAWRNTLLFGGLCVGMVVVASIYSYGGSTTTYADKQSLNAQSVQKVAITGTSVDVHVKQGTGTTIEATLTGTGSADRFRLHAIEAGDHVTIEVTEEDMPFFNLMGTQDLRLDVTLPQRQLADVTVDLSSGDLYATGLRASQVNVETSSGDLTIDDLQGDKLRFKSSSGDQTIRNVSGEIATEASSGHIRLELAELVKPLTMELSSGDGEIRVPSGSNFRYRVETSSGDIQLKGLTHAVPSASDEDEDVRSGEVGSGGPLIQAHASSGDIRITN